MPRQTRHDGLLSLRRNYCRRTTAWRSADRYDRRLRLEPLEDRLALTVLTVNSLEDGRINLGDATVTLRDALDAANRDVQVSTRGPSGSGADEIQFLAGLSGIITLSFGQLPLSSDLTITGPGASALTVAGDNLSHLFSVNEGGVTTKVVVISGLNISGGATVRGIFNAENLTVENCTISGHTLSDGGGIYNHALGTLSVLNSTITGSSAGDRGGGISNFGTLTVQNSTISGNSAGAVGGRGGGGIYSRGTFVLQNSTVSGNSTAGLRARGGGIRAAGSVTLIQSTVSGNHTAGDEALGGGIDAFGSVTLTQSTVSGNSTAGILARGGGIVAGAVTLTQSTVSGNHTAGDSADGGGIYTFGSVSLTQSTVSGNRTAGERADGGGIWNFGPVDLTQSTVTDNHALHTDSIGGGVFHAGTPPFTINGSIVAGNTAGGGGADLFKDPQSTLTVNYSLIGTGIVTDAGGNNIPTNAPQLGPLRNNGGPTETRALLAGSPAIDKGDPSVAFDAAEFDQRGAPFVRVVHDGSATDFVGLSEIKFAGKLSGAPGAMTVITPTQAFASTYYATAQSPINLINNSGLDTSSGNVQSFTHAADGIATGMWSAGGGQGTFGDAPVVADQYVVLDLGANYDLSAAYLWQMVQTGLLGRGIKEFRLLASAAAPSAADVASPPAAYNLSGFTEILGAATLFQAPTSGSVATQTFILSGAANIRQIYLDVVSDHNEPGIDIGAFELQPTTASADFDGDADVDGADLLAWQRGLGATGPDATRANGNADNDGDVDGADLGFWKAQFGGPPPAAAAALAAGQAARPLAAPRAETPGTIGTTSIRFDARLPFRMTGSPSPDGPAAIVGAVAPRVLQAKSAHAALGHSAPRDAAAFDWADWLSDSRRARDEAESMLPGNERLDEYHSDYQAAADGVFLHWDVHSQSENIL